MQNFLLHGIFIRVVYWFHNRFNTPNLQELIHRSFAIWASRAVRLGDFNVVHVFSGVAEEIFTALDDDRILKIFARGSAHIQTQQRRPAQYLQ